MDRIAEKHGTLRILFTEEQVALRIQELAAHIDALYKGEPLVMICVLKGAFMFFSDLAKRLSGQPQIDFIRAASYGNEVTGSNNISFTKDVEVSLAGKHVLVVEDIVDSGRTVRFLLDRLSARGVKSLRIAALIDKKERREVDVTVDFAGFSISSGFIVGYGLDYAEEYRNIPAVCVLDLNG